MKIAPVSGDFLVKSALVLLGVGVAVYVVRKASSAASDVASQAWNTATDAAWAVTPWNNNNVIYQTANEALFPDGKESIGTWLYGLLNPEPEPTKSPDWHTGEGRWNNPSAYERETGGTTPGYTGSGGAAFGIYPRP